MAVTIITDSGSDISISDAARLNIDLVPVWILFGEERFRDGIDIDRATFFRRLQNGEAPRTEPATEEQFRQAFARVVSSGNDGVMITLSSEISKSYELASNAAKTFGDRLFCGAGFDDARTQRPASQGVGRAWVRCSTSV